MKSRMLGRVLMAVLLLHGAVFAIIVENGHATLEGAVENELQKTVAGTRASTVPMTFGPIVNRLVVADPPA